MAHYMLSESNRKAVDMKCKKKIKTMDFILILLAIMTLLFTITMMVFFYKFQMIPDTLCTCWFAAVVGECGGMSWIKTNKDKIQDRQWAKEDRENERKEGENL